MKLISILLTYLLFINTALAGLPPTTASGLSDSTKTTTFNFKVPNNQSTKITGATLLETGNQNILKDPSLEGANNSSAWVFTGGTLTIDNTPIHGLINGQIDTTATSLSMTQSSTLYQAQFADGVQGLASMRVRVPSSITTPIYVCSIQNGVEGSTSSGCVRVQANSKWGLYKVPFILGATSNGIALTSKGVSYTGTIEWDDGFVGAVDLKQDVDQSRIAGESYFAGTTNCVDWTRTSATIGALAADTDCPGPTISYSSLGSWQTTDSNLPRQTINNLPAGTYKAKFIFASSMTAAASNAYAINDGSTTCYAIEGETSTGLSSITVECTFVYTSPGSRVFELYVGSSSNTITVVNNRTAPTSGMKFILEYFGSGSVYSSTNADYGSTAFTATGSWTANSTYSGFQWRQGEYLYVRGQIALAGAPTAAALTINIPSGLTIDTAKLTASLSAGDVPSLGTTAFLDSGVANYVGSVVYSSSTVVSLKYFVASTANSTTGTVTQAAPFTFGSSDVVYYEYRVPIVGWTQSNIIIGSFNGLESCSSTLECTDTFSAKVSNTGVVSGENADFINGNCVITTTNKFTCTYNSSVFTVAPNCQVNAQAIPQTTIFQITQDETTSTASQLVFSTYSGATTQSADARAVIISCQKQGVDYIGKTAKAVASDQNIATPGLTKVKACYYAFGGASATLASPTECTSGTCVEVIDSCGTGTPPTRSGSAGVYNDLTFASGTFANNTFVRCDCTSYDVTNAEIRQCTPYFVTADQTISSTASGSYVANIYSDNASGVNSDSYSIVTCEGQAP